jgi:CRISPR/Cas system-associated exonuclease Cas4 (RecB family)
MVEQRLLWEEAWLTELERIWNERLEELIASLGQQEGELGRPETWPDYQLKKARLRLMTRRLREVLIAEPRETAFLLEENLRDHSGRIQGRADLVLRRPGAHRIIDFKTGRAVDRLTGEVRQGYASQLQLYAFLEHETTGEWPVRAHLFPLEGEPVAVEIDPAVSEAVAARALSILDLYNSRVPGEQAADATPDNCRYCPHSGVCPAFWSAYGESWPEKLLAVVGTTTEVFRTALAGTNLELERIEGIPVSKVLIRNIDPATHPIVDQLALGNVIAAVGFRRESQHDSFYLPPGGVLATR